MSLRLLATATAAADNDPSWGALIIFALFMAAIVVIIHLATDRRNRR